MFHPRNTLTPGNWCHIFIGLVLLTASTWGNATGWVKILKDTPAEVFDEADLRMFLDTAKQVLEAEGEPQSTPWTNPATGAGGGFLVLKQSVAKDGSPCKRVRFMVYAAKRSAKKATWTACKIGDSWKIASAG